VGTGSVKARVLHAGTAEAPAVVLDAPLSLWGGFDAANGRVMDTRHPQRGASLAGRVLVMPAARGSSSSASVLVEAARAGVAPAAIVLAEPDLILTIGAVVAQELYGVVIPVVVIPSASVRDGASVRISEDGEVTAPQ
jgi:predicted aconitase with swiveling domain